MRAHEQKMYWHCRMCWEGYLRMMPYLYGFTNIEVAHMRLRGCDRPFMWRDDQEPTCQGSTEVHPYHSRAARGVRCGRSARALRLGVGCMERMDRGMRALNRHYAQTHMMRRLKEHQAQERITTRFTGECDCNLTGKRRARFKEQPQVCSCYACGNVRRHEKGKGRLTMQERRAQT